MWTGVYWQDFGIVSGSNWRMEVVVAKIQDVLVDMGSAVRVVLTMEKAEIAVPQEALSQTVKPMSGMILVLDQQDRAVVPYACQSPFWLI